MVHTNAEHAALFWSRWATGPSACLSHMRRDRSGTTVRLWTAAAHRG